MGEAKMLMQRGKDMRDDRFAQGPGQRKTVQRISQPAGCRRIDAQDVAALGHVAQRGKIDGILAQTQGHAGPAAKLGRDAPIGRRDGVFQKQGIRPFGQTAPRLGGGSPSP